MSLEVRLQNAHVYELLKGVKVKLMTCTLNSIFFILRLCLFIDFDASQSGIFIKAQCLKEDVILLLLYIKQIYLHLTIACMHSSL